MNFGRTPLSPQHSIFSMAYALIQECHIYIPQAILIVSRKTVFYNHRHILKQSPSLQNPNLLPDVNLPILSFKTLHNPNFCFQVYFPMIPVKYSHSRLLKHRPLLPTSLAPICIFLNMVSPFQALMKCQCNLALPFLNHIHTQFLDPYNPFT